jgi:simple sugar transport system ATP-binding protein
MDEPTTALTQARGRQPRSHVVRKPCSRAGRGGALREPQARRVHMPWAARPSCSATAQKVAQGPHCRDFDQGRAGAHWMTGQASIDDAAVPPPDARRRWPGSAEGARRSVAAARSCSDVELRARTSGEILGVTGLLDSGRNELALALAGVAGGGRAGRLELDGQVIALRQRRATAFGLGIGYVPEDRLERRAVSRQVRSSDNIVSARDLEPLRGPLRRCWMPQRGRVLAEAHRAGPAGRHARRLDAPCSRCRAATSSACSSAAGSPSSRAC